MFMILPSIVLTHCGGISKTEREEKKWEQRVSCRLEEKLCMVKVSLCCGQYGLSHLALAELKKL